MSDKKMSNKKAFAIIIPIVVALAVLGTVLSYDPDPAPRIIYPETPDGGPILLPMVFLGGFFGGLLGVGGFVLYAATVFIRNNEGDK